LKFDKLKDVLPLNTPVSILIDPSNVCNFKCTFCPTGNIDMRRKSKRPIGRMSYELFKKIINDISKFESKINIIKLYKDGEPLLNKNIYKMINYAKKKNITNDLHITTNASLLNRENTANLINAGIDSIKISVEHVSNKGYKDITQISHTTYDDIYNNVAYLYKYKMANNPNVRLHVKIEDTGLTKKEIQKFMSDFTPISDTISIDHLMGWASTGEQDLTLGVNSDKKTDGSYKSNNEKNVCPTIFYSLSISFNGDISPCCIDWNHSLVLGNVNDNSLLEIWNGESVKSFRLDQLMGKRKSYDLCKSCDYLASRPSSTNLDSYKHDLIDIYQNN
jgi:radical SAM protein with 4Fe4S-binding SPASM domain